ncbi:MAG: 2-dehydro-3-deoxyphosphooctonate aldolase [Flavobacteriaceae bacterium]|nr:2-dehydro-3-deoxyphosphooctonate aldolase [Flavobacteriaceae bacterium]
MKFIVLFTAIALSFTSCVSTKSTLQNVNDNAPIPQLTSANTFLLSEFSRDPKYGYHPDYPINVFYQNTKDLTINQERFLNALSGPNGEKIFFKKLEICCPFPTKNCEMGGGFLDVYEVTWVRKKQPIQLYLNIYEKGALMVPMGFGLAK